MIKELAQEYISNHPFCEVQAIEDFAEWLSEKIENPNWTQGTFTPRRMYLPGGEVIEFARRNDLEGRLLRDDG